MFNCKLAFSIPNTFKNFIKRGKDKLDFLSNQNVVYMISCDDCEASYWSDKKKIEYEITRISLILGRILVLLLS